MAQNLIVRGLIGTFVFIHTVLALACSLLPNGVAKIVQLILGWPFFYFWITIDRVFCAVGTRLNPFVAFPRNTIEVTDRGEEFFELIKTFKPLNATKRDYSTLPKTWAKGQFSPLPLPEMIPKDAEFVSMKRSSETDAFIKEKLKQIQVSFYNLTFKTGGKNVTVELFVKTPGQRTVTRELLALGNTFSERNQEQRFYDDILPNLDPSLTNVPHGHANFGSRMFSHTCIVCTKVDTSIWKSQTDAQGMTMPMAQALVKASARLHAQFWNPPPNCPKTRRFTDRTSLSWLDSGMKLYLTDKETPSELERCPPWMTSLWATLTEFYNVSNMCISHADCRPGNMLFSKEASPGSLQSQEVVPGSERVPSTEIIMTDWEACSFTPASYDVCYSMLCGLPPHERRMYQRYLFDLHWDSLIHTLKKTNPAAAAKLESKGDAGFIETNKDFAGAEGYNMLTHKDRMELEVDIHPVTIYYFGWLLVHVGGVGETQGNLEGDTEAWGDRIRGGILDSFLCDGGQVDPCNDGYSAWTGPQTKRGCCCEDKTSMADLGIISIKKGNQLPGAEPGSEPTQANRCNEGSDGAVRNMVDPDYSRMHLSERHLKFLAPYHKIGRERNDLMKGKAKSNPKKFNRTLREDLLGMIESAALMGRKDAMAKAEKESAKTK